jgi:hypothetical protein
LVCSSSSPPRMPPCAAQYTAATGTVVTIQYDTVKESTGHPLFAHDPHHQAAVGTVQEIIVQCSAVRPITVHRPTQGLPRQVAQTNAAAGPATCLTDSTPPP